MAAVSSHFEPNGLLEHLLEWDDMTGRSPELQFRIAMRAQRHEKVLAAIEHRHRRERL
jgi:hypothetical protein